MYIKSRTFIDGIARITDVRCAVFLAFLAFETKRYGLAAIGAKISPHAFLHEFMTRDVTGPVVWPRIQRRFTIFATRHESCCQFTYKGLNWGVCLFRSVRYAACLQ